MSRTRLMRTVSFQAGRTIGVAVPPRTACNWPTRSGISFGECSVSSRIQSKPESEMMSAAMLLNRLDHRPICNWPAAMACLKALRWKSVVIRSSREAAASHELDGQPAERPEIGVQGITFLREDDPGEGAGKHDMPGLERVAVRADLVGEPGDAERGVAEHAGGEPRLLDLGIAVHDAADPAQVDVHRADRA